MSVYRLVIIAVLLASSIGLAISQDTTTNQAGMPSRMVEIIDSTFQPETIEISAGTTVTWINRGDTPNAVTSMDGRFSNSGNMNAGDRYSYTFNEAGTFEYRSNNPQNTGTVRVTAGTTGIAGVQQNQTNQTIGVSDLQQNQTIIINETAGTTGVAGIQQSQTADATGFEQNQTIGAAGTPLVVRREGPVVVGMTQPVEVRPEQAQVRVEQPQSVLIRSVPVVTRGGANATRVTPQTVASANVTPVVVREEQPILVREPRQVTVQPQPVEVTVEQPQPVIIRTVPIVSVSEQAAANETIGAANVTEAPEFASVIVLNRTGAATAPMVVRGTVPVEVGQTQPVVVQPQPTQIQVEQPQAVLVRAETVVTRAGADAAQVTPQVVPSPNQSIQVVSERQQVIVHEPQPVVVQPQPVQVTVEQPQTILVRTVPVVSVVGYAGTNQTIGAANQTIGTMNQTIGTMNQITGAENATAETAAPANVTIAGASVENETRATEEASDTTSQDQTGMNGNITIGNATGGQIPYIRAMRQTISNDSVIIAEVYSNGPGWADVHTDLNGEPNSTNIIGYTHVDDGLSRNVSVRLNRTNDTSITDPLWAMLHIDTGNIGVHEFPGPDVEATMPNGTRVRMPFNVSVTGTRYRIV